MAAGFMHAIGIWRIACQARDRAIAEAAQKPDEYTSDSLAALILSAAAAEGFINELGEILNPLSFPQEDIYSRYAPFHRAMREIEDARGRTELKYLVGSLTLSGTMFDKGMAPYQDFTTLKGLRDQLMHLKIVNQAVKEGGLLRFRLPPKIQTLRTRGLARPDDGKGISWVSALQTDRMAIWACEASGSIMLAFLEMLPDSELMQWIDIWKKTLRDGMNLKK